MKKTAIAWLLTAAVFGLAGPRAASAQTLLFDYVGFDYENPNPTPATFGELGSGYVGVGEVPGLFLPLVADTANNQYTYIMYGLTSINVQSVGPFLIVDYTPGTLEVWEDSKATGTTGDFGSNPPNATAPSTFNDGTLFVSGPLTNFRFVFNIVSNSGSFDSDYAVTGGSQLGNLIAYQQTTGWTFSGATSNALNIPSGYYHQIDGQTFLNKPVPATKSTWGKIKADYR
jgi:hypothetical protein